MHIRSILAIARKDALDILLNKSTLIMLLSPIFVAIVFAGVGVLFGGKTTNALIYDPDKSGVEQVLKSAYSDLSITYTNSPDGVTSAFGSNGIHKSSTYALGLIVASNFDSSLQTGGHPQLQLFVNGDDISTQQQLLLQGAITNYTRNVASPQPPANISVATINPPNPTDTGIQDLTQFYAIAIVLTSLYVGSSLVPGIMAEEKERKTLRMLMVTPASFTDVVLGKLLVGLVYQVVLTAIVLTINKGFSGQIPLLLLFALLGACFSVSLGLLAGSFFQTTGSAGAFAGIVSFIYLIPVFFVGLFAQLFQNNPFTPFIRALPTYYIADGVSNAIQGRSTFGSILLDGCIVVGSILVFIAIATWSLRRQAAVVGSI